MRASPGRGSVIEPAAPVAAFPPPLPPLPPRPASLTPADAHLVDLDAPLAGVSSAIVTAATRRVARRWRDEAAAAGLPPVDSETVAGVLAAEVQHCHGERVVGQLQHEGAQPGRLRLRHGQQLALGDAVLRPGREQVHAPEGPTDSCIGERLVAISRYCVHA